MTESMSAIEKLFLENDLNSPVILEKVIELGADFLGGKWRNTQRSEVNVSRITGGQSNHMFHVTSSSGATEYLLRIHRQLLSHVFKDTVNFAVFSERGLGPKLYGVLDGARMEEYLPSRTMDRMGVMEAGISRQIGAVFPHYHSINMPVSRSRRAPQVMREWLEEYKRLGGGEYEIRPRTVTYSDHPKCISIEALRREIDCFEKWASEIYEHTVVFSHNDLACGNVLQLTSSNDIVLIDWEFATYNWRGFDLAMHLAETGIDYNVPAPGAKFLQELCEDHPNVRVFCEGYIDADNKLKKLTPTEQDRQCQVATLIEEVEFFWPFTMLFWLFQSLMYKELKYDNGVDMDVVCSDRLAVYFHLKPRSERIYEKLRKQ